MSDIKEKKKLQIAGITIWRILAYFMIYSISGYIIETAFGFFTKGLLESRKGFLYGPFCPIYGVGAVIMILALQPFKKNNYTLFFGGFLVGSIVEYIISLLGEVIFKVNWWDYSDRFLNINGRVCFTFSLFWGLLAIYLIRHFNPRLDKIMNKIRQRIPTKVIKTCVVIVSIFLLVDAILTGIAVKLFFSRTVYIYNLDVTNKEKYINEYKGLINYDNILKLEYKIFSDKKMIKTFPNLKLKATDGGIVYMDSIYKEIQPYYYKFEF